MSRKISYTHLPRFVARDLWILLTCRLYLKTSNQVNLVLERSILNLGSTEIVAISQTSETTLTSFLVKKYMKLISPHITMTKYEIKYAKTLIL